MKDLFATLIYYENGVLLVHNKLPFSYGIIKCISVFIFFPIFRISTTFKKNILIYVAPAYYNVCVIVTVVYFIIYIQVFLVYNYNVKWDNKVFLWKNRNICIILTF